MSKAASFDRMLELVGTVLGAPALARMQVIIDDPEAVAATMARAMREVRTYRRRDGDAFCFNWLLHLPFALQQPFEPTHAAMAALDITMDAPPHERAATLRRLFSGIVAGNVKADGIARIAAHGPYRLRGDPTILAALDRALGGFAAEGRMRLHGEYVPCYRLDGTD